MASSFWHYSATVFSGSSTHNARLLAPRSSPPSLSEGSNHQRSSLNPSRRSPRLDLSTRRHHKQTSVLMFRSAGPELAALVATGEPFFATPWRADEVGVRVDASSDWREIGELITESYCLDAPTKLARAGRTAARLTCRSIPPCRIPTPTARRSSRSPPTRRTWRACSESW